MRNQPVASVTAPALAFDPRTLQAPGEGRVLDGIRSVEQRAGITAAVTRVLKNYLARDASGRLRVHPGVYAAIRSQPCDAAGTAVDAALKAAAIADPSGAIGRLQDVLIRSLERRTELQAQLRALDALAEICGVDQITPAGVGR